MSVENPLWGAPRIHGELLKLGFSVAQSSVAKYMVKQRGPPSQGWRTFLRNHAPDIAAMDLFAVPTIGFKLLYGFVIVRIDRRDWEPHAWKLSRQQIPQDRQDHDQQHGKDGSAPDPVHSRTSYSNARLRDHFPRTMFPRRRRLRTP